jgi:hypothetical protein
MPVITHQTKLAADVKREPQSDMTQLESPNVQLYMTHSSESAFCEASPELWEWVEATARDLETCPLSVLLGAAEFVREME